jgi:hypothetical protein
MGRLGAAYPGSLLEAMRVRFRALLDMMAPSQFSICMTGGVK